MKKIFFIIGIISSIFFMLLFTSCSNQNKDKKLLGYLETRYNEQSFTIVSTIEKTELDETVLYEYIVSPNSNKEIIFNAGQKQSGSNIFPFMPPIKEKVFFDNYFEKCKEYIVEKNEKEFIVDNKSEIGACASKIYQMMRDINDELSGYGISVTEYTPSVILNVVVNGAKKEIDFYIMDEIVIQNLLSEAYEK